MAAQSTGFMDLLLSQEPEASTLHVTEAQASSPAQTETPGSSSKSQSKRGRPSKGDGDVWTHSATETLFKVRHVIAKEEFMRARNHVEIGAAWGDGFYAAEYSRKEGLHYAAMQGQHKMKWLKKK